MITWKKQLQLNTQPIKYERTKWGKKNNNKNPAKVNSDQHDKLVTQVIRVESTPVNSSKPRSKSRLGQPDKKKNKENHKVYFLKKSYDEIEKENKSKEKENNVNHINFSNS